MVILNLIWTRYILYLSNFQIFSLIVYVLFFIIFLWLFYLFLYVFSLIFALLWHLLSGSSFCGWYLFEYMSGPDLDELIFSVNRELKKVVDFVFKLALFSEKAKFILFSNSTDARSRDVSISPTYNDDIANFIKNLERITITSPPSPASYLNPWMFFILFLLKTFWHLRHTNQSIIRSSTRISYIEF